jgi:hypothetical protein
MTPEEKDKPVRELIAKVYLPPDLCPSDPDAIEAMLDAAGGQLLTDEQVERMLKKARGELPVGERRDEDEQAVWLEEGLTEQERELVALHRNDGGELPPEIKEKLRRLREKAKTEPDEREDCDDELEP